MASPILTPPTNGRPITMENSKLTELDKPIIPFIEGDGTRPDIWSGNCSRSECCCCKSLFRTKANQCLKSTRAKQPSISWVPGFPMKK